MIDIQQHWKELSALVAGIVWLVRLESKVAANEKHAVKICKLVSDDAGEARFTSKTVCQQCRDECKRATHSTEIILFRKIDDLCEKLDKRQQDQANISGQLASIAATIELLPTIIKGILSEVEK